MTSNVAPLAVCANDAPDDGAADESRVQAAMLSAAIGGTVANPLADGLDDDTPRRQLLTLSRRILEIP